MFPTHGPVAGGTDIFIWGGFFGEGNITVQIADSDIEFKVNPRSVKRDLIDPFLSCHNFYGFNE